MMYKPAELEMRAQYPVVYSNATKGRELQLCNEFCTLHVSDMVAYTQLVMHKIFCLLGIVLRLKDVRSLSSVH